MTCERFIRKSWFENATARVSFSEVLTLTWRRRWANTLRVLSAMNCHRSDRGFPSPSVPGGAGAEPSRVTGRRQSGHTGTVRNQVRRHEEWKLCVHGSAVFSSEANGSRHTQQSGLVMGEGGSATDRGTGGGVGAADEMCQEEYSACQ